MAPSLHFTEPHPSGTSKKQSRVLGSGRGGAGNYARYEISTLTTGHDATGPAMRTASTSKPASRSSYASTGIGGAGNVRPSSERRVFSFDEELERQARLAENAARTPVFQVGRGGAGNTFNNRTSFAAEPSAEGAKRGSSAASVSSAGSATSGVERAKKSLEGMRGKMARALSRE